MRKTPIIPVKLLDEEQSGIPFRRKKKIEIYYWRFIKFLRPQLQIVHTKEDLKNYYKKLPVEYIYDGSTSVEERMNEVFDIMNLDNPLVDKKGQDWIKKNLQPDPHTSMSTGDIIKIETEYWLVMPMGWKKLNLR